MNRSTYIPPFNLSHTNGPLRYARFIVADGEPTGGTPETSEGEQAAAPTAGNTGGEDADPEPVGDGHDEDDLPDDPAKLKALLKRARADAGKARINAKEKAAQDAKNDLIQQMGKALGLVKDDKDNPTADQLTEQLAAQQDAAEQAQTQLAVYRAAGKLADPDMLLDSSSFLTSLKDVDVSDVAAVQEAVKTFVTKHPKFAPTQVAGASTVEHPGGTGEGKGQSVSLNDAVAKALQGK